ncbi:MAG: tetratricopeptide repeat protein [Pseudomonadota bacterium]
MPYRILSTLAGVALLTCSCVMTREEGQQMESDMRAIEQELALERLEKKKHEAELTDRLKAAELQVERMKNAMESADQNARRADADFFLKLDEMVAQVQRMNGRLEEIEHRLGEIENGAVASSKPATPADPGTAITAPTEVPDASALPADKQALYDLGKKSFDEGHHNEARRIFKVFLGRHPDDATLSDNALFWTAESFFQEKTYDKAILTYQEVINKYPKSDKLDASLYKIGRSFEALGLKEDASLFYEDLVAKYPGSKLVSDAKKRIATNKPKGGKRRSR